LKLLRALPRLDSEYQMRTASLRHAARLEIRSEMGQELHPEYAAELPMFVGAISEIFKPAEIRQYLDGLRRTKYRRLWAALLPEEDSGDQQAG
jgi:hypothetical protein